MRQTAVILLIVLLAITAAAASTTTQPSKSEQTKAEWNRVLCIALHMLQMVAVGVTALIIMVAGLKYLTSGEIDAREDSKKMIARSITILVALTVVVQVVNYVVSGSSIKPLDINSCNDLQTTTQPKVTTTLTSTTTGPSTTTNGTTTTVATTSTTTPTTTTSSSTSTTFAGSCTDPSNPYSIPNKNSCQKASAVNQCNTDYYPAGGNGVTDLDDILGAGFSRCCCDNGYPKCC